MSDREIIRLATIGVLWAVVWCFWNFITPAHAQALLTPTEVHVSGDTLITATTQYTITWGHNCDAIPFDGDVLVWPIDGVLDQAAMAPMDEDGQVATRVVTDGDTEASQMCSVALSPMAILEGGTTP